MVAKNPIIKTIVIMVFNTISNFVARLIIIKTPFSHLFKSEAKAVLGRQSAYATPWLTERHGYDPTCGDGGKKSNN